METKIETVIETRAKPGMETEAIFWLMSIHYYDITILMTVPEMLNALKRLVYGTMLKITMRDTSKILYYFP